MNPSELARLEEEAAEQPTEPFDVVDFLKALEIEQTCHGFEPPATHGGVRPMCFRCGRMTLPPLWICREDVCPLKPLA